ncbi:MAG: hypothetical protein K8S54_13050 [Spirochaetia bacterium]|nr:hypothetical protein [Spirochaetia bacterium]
MNSILIFAVCLLLIVIIAKVVNSVTGTKAHYIEDFVPESGESVRWRDDKADSYLVPVFGRALVNSYARMKRFTVILTNRRIIVGQKALFVSKRMIQFEVAFDAQTAKQSPEIFYPRGYLLLQADRSAVDFGTQNDKPCLKLEPVAASRDKNNVASILIFTDDLESLRAAWPT